MRIEVYNYIAKQNLIGSVLEVGSLDVTCTDGTLSGLVTIVVNATAATQIGATVGDPA